MQANLKYFIHVGTVGIKTWPSQEIFLPHFYYQCFVFSPGSSRRRKVGAHLQKLVGMEQGREKYAHVLFTFFESVCIKWAEPLANGQGLVQLCL